MITICANPTLAVGQAAARILATKPGAHIALPGGTTPAPLFALLPQLPGVGIWQTDERMVDALSRERNAALFTSWQARVGGLQLELLQGALAEPCAQVASHRFASQARCFDLVVLGMGTDGHVASVFPDETVRADTTYVPARGGQRVSLSERAIHSARRIVVLALGFGKADAVARAVTRDRALPAGRLPAHCEWILDDDAARAIR